MWISVRRQRRSTITQRKLRSTRFVRPIPQNRVKMIVQNRVIQTLDRKHARQRLQTPFEHLLAVAVIHPCLWVISHQERSSHRPR
jgi:hypothetical protein